MSTFFAVTSIVTLIGSLGFAGYYAARPRKWQWAGVFVGLAILATINLVGRS